jgi:ATP-dependent RNA helicase SUPV3L1/SUV3
VAANADVPAGFYRAIGYSVHGGRAVRLDGIEKLAAAARRLAAAGPFQATRELGAIVGGSNDDLAAVLADLGYRAEGDGDAVVFAPVKRGRGNGKPKGKQTRKRPRKGDRVDPHSPFARLKELKVTSR